MTATVVNFAHYKTKFHPQPIISPIRSTNIDAIDIVRTIFDAAHAIDGTRGALLAMQEIVVAACSAIEREAGRDAALETLLLYAATTR